MVATLVLGQAKLATPLMVVPISAIVSRGMGRKRSVFFWSAQTARKMWRGAEPCSPDAAFGNMVAMTKGVNVGDRVMLNGATLVNDGQVVRIIQ